MEVRLHHCKSVAEPVAEQLHRANSKSVLKTSEYGIGQIRHSTGLNKISLKEIYIDWEPAREPLGWKTSRTYTAANA